MGWKGVTVGLQIAIWRATRELSALRRSFARPSEVTVIWGEPNWLLQFMDRIRFKRKFMNMRMGWDRLISGSVELFALQPTSWDEGRERGRARLFA
jgi:hypothetical protein